MLSFPIGSHAKESQGPAVVPDPLRLKLVSQKSRIINAAFHESIDPLCGSESHQIATIENAAHGIVREVVEPAIHVF